MDEREYQNEVRTKLERLYEEVEVQWHPFRGQGYGIYAPKIDVAVGPYAIEARYGNRYSELLTETRSFIESLIERHNRNVEGYEEQTSFQRIERFNENARCLLCIEIEKSGGRKHCLGNLVNASALGRIGLLVARSDEMLRVFLRQRVYLSYLKSVEKNTFRTDNAIVLTETQFDECLDAIGQRNRRR